MVVIFLPTAALTGNEHERIGWPSMWTVHAPHWATPQPYLVPVSPACSRIAQSSGWSGSTSRSSVFPLMFSFMVTPPGGELHSYFRRFQLACTVERGRTAR